MRLITIHLAAQTPEQDGLLPVELYLLTNSRLSIGELSHGLE